MTRALPTPFPRSLSDLEAEVLAHVASGATNGEIAERLRYSPNYIKDVVLSARAGLGARDRAHAAALAVALGMVRPRLDDHARFVPVPAEQPLTPTGAD